MAVPVLLMAAVLYNIFGYFVVYQVNRAQVRSEMRKKIASEGRQVLVLKIVNAEKDPSFRRIDNREMEFNDCLYDVLYELKKGDTTTFYCIRDTREEILMAGMRKTTKAKVGQNLLSHLITIAMPVLPAGVEVYGCSEITFPRLIIRLRELPADPLPPPPEIS